MGATNPSVVNIEVVRKGLPILWDADNNVTYDKLVDGVKKFKITSTPNSNDFRIPLEIKDAGIYGGVDLNGGVVTEASGPELAQMYQSYKAQMVGFTLTQKDIDITEDGSLSNVNLLKHTISRAIPVAKRYANASFFSDGFGMAARGLIAHATAYAGGTFTFETEFAANLLVPGMAVEIFDDALTTHRTSGVPTNLPKIASVSADRTQATINNYGGITPAATDYLAFPGVGSTPSWVNGLYYFQTTSSSGSILGLSKTTYPEIMPSLYNASGNNIDVAFGYSLQVKIRQRRGAVPNLTGIIHPVQAGKLALLAQTISEFQRGGTNLPDLAYSAPKQETITQWGVSHLVDSLASMKRVDWILKSEFGRVYNRPIDFHRDPISGKYFFEDRDSSTARVKMSWSMFLRWSENFFYADPGSGGAIYGLNCTL